jgi:hypothetical protein
MPSYDFYDADAGEYVTLTMKIAELDEFKAAHPNMRQQLSRVNVCDPTRVGVTTKPDSGFRDLLKDIKGKHYGSEIDTH